MSVTYDLRVVDLSNITAAGTVVDGIAAFTWADRLSDVTDFKLDVAYDAAAVASLTAGKVLRLKLNSTVVWCGVIERIVRNPVTAGEESEENITYSGRSLGCILDRMAMRPSMGFGVEPWGPSRVFSFSEIHYDASAWPAAIELGAVIDPSAFWKIGQPSGFPGLNVKGIATTGDTDSAAAQGYRYFVKDFVVDADSAVAIFLSADNSADVDVDGFRVASITAGADTTEGLRTTRAVTMFLTAATIDAPTHRISARVVNVPFGGGDPGPGTGSVLTGNPTRFLAVGYKVDEQGRLGDKLFETDDTWSALATPDDPPGMTFGQIIGVVRNQQLATLTGLSMFTLGFDDTDDTGSNPWTPIESWATQVGDSLLKLMRDAGQLYADWRFGYDAVRLDAWELGTYTVDSLVTYNINADPAVSTVLELQRDVLDIGTDVLIVGYPGGQIRVPDTGGTRAGFLQVDAATIGEAKNDATQLLDLQGQPEQVTVKIAPTGTGDVPGKDWKVGDIIHVADGDGGLLDERVMEWGGTLTDDGIEFTVVVKDLHLAAFEAFERHMQRMGNGSLGGSAASAPSGRPMPSIARISQGEITFHEQREAIIGQSPAHKIPTTSGNVFGVKASIPSLDVDGFDIITTSDTIVDLWALDAPGGTAAVVATVTIPAGEYVGIAAIDPIAWLDAYTSEVWPDVTAAASETAELTVEPLTV